MTSKEAKEKLKVLYGCRCLLTLIERERYTYHHIEKKEHGGEITIENGANLIREIHEWLHSAIEQNDIELFYLINECLKLYKKCLDNRKYDLIEQYEQECVPLFVKAYKRRN